MENEEDKLMCHKRTEIKKFMSSQGFNLIREKNHLIWRDDFGNQIVTPSSASDFRTIKKVESTILRLRSNTGRKLNRFVACTHNMHSL